MNQRLKLPAVAVVMPGLCGLLIAFFTARAATSASTQGQPPIIGGQKPAFQGQPPASLQGQPAVMATAKPLQLPASLPNSVEATMTKAPAMGDSGVLDQRRQFALGMIETGNHDGEIGGAGEVSRYQIMPAVWRHYSGSRNYHDPEVSLEVARQHWAALYSTFKRQARREPTDFDMYVLWNTHAGYYSGRAFDPARIAPVVRNRAQRYVNLVQWGQNG